VRHTTHIIFLLSSNHLSHFHQQQQQQQKQKQKQKTKKKQKQKTLITLVSYKKLVALTFSSF